MRVPACLAAALLLAVSTSAVRAATAYGEAFNELYRIDLGSGDADAIGDAGYVGRDPITDITGLAYGPDGRLYAVSDTLKSLLTLDTSSGSASVVGSLGLAGQGDAGHNDALDFGMTFDCDGNLWLSSATTGKLWSVDRHSGATRSVATLAHPVTGLAVRGAVLYGAGGRGDNTFYRIDPATGEATAIGGFGADLDGIYVNSVALGFDAGGTLWAAINYNPPASDDGDLVEWSDLATIDPATGAVEIQGDITGPSALRYVGMKGLAIGPLQCDATSGGSPAGPGAATGLPALSPWMLALLVLLLGAAGLRARRPFAHLD
jgi:hypothetical protein